MHLSKIFLVLSLLYIAKVTGGPKNMAYFEWLDNVSWKKAEIGGYDRDGSPLYVARITLDYPQIKQIAASYHKKKNIIYYASSKSIGNRVVKQFSASKLRSDKFKDYRVQILLRERPEYVTWVLSNKKFNESQYYPKDFDFTTSVGTCSGRKHFACRAIVDADLILGSFEEWREEGGCILSHKGEIYNVTLFEVLTVTMMGDMHRSPKTLTNEHCDEKYARKCYW